MLANHTSIAFLFERMLKQFNTLFNRRAFIDQYKRVPVFADGLEEFESARDVVRLLADEYRAAETPDYVSWAAGTDDAPEAPPEDGPDERAPPSGRGGGEAAASASSAAAGDDASYGVDAADGSPWDE